MAPSSRATALAVLDVAAGASVSGARVAGWLLGPPARRILPLARQAAAAGAATAPRAAVDLAHRWRREGGRARDLVRHRAEELFEAAVPVVLDVVLDQIDLTALVLRRVDVNAVVAAADVDAVAARLDLDTVAARLDLDTVAARLDVEKILDRMDLDALIEQRVDLDRVAAGLDVEKILDRIDLDALIEQRVDLDRVAAGLDVEKVLDRVDIIGLAEFVVDGIDLPRIIRESTGSVASEGLRGVRTRSMEADQALARFADRMLLRRRSHRNGARDDGADRQRADLAGADLDGTAAPATRSGGAGVD
jgi:hypothetical protein